MERFHQTQNKWLTAHPAATIAELQHLCDQFRVYYNQRRPHRALDRRTPTQAYTRRPKATATGYVIPAHCRIRTDTIDAAGAITIRYNSRPHHIGLGKRRTGTKITVLIDDRDIRVLDRNTGQLIRKLVLDPPATTNPAASNAETAPKTGNRGFEPATPAFAAGRFRWFSFVVASRCRATVFGIPMMPTVVANSR